ncbi:MAG TPA: serine/threonine-protein kinase [Polyangiaceae bacterium]|nr:serine/threonine-protein kinase [Polyangiaceae bacterium]
MSGVASEPADGPKLVGRYALFDEIACGGMAAVHVGRLVGPVGFSRTVAIKRLHPQFAKDPEFVTMFLDEARLAARVRHPNVVPTLDVVASQGELFLVMEYVQGESFARLLHIAKSNGQRIPRDIVCAILASVLHGLHAAHEAKSERGEPLGIVHRDVSPQNILVGVDGIARVLDFGIAKAAGRAQVTREGQVRGKMAYIAPEQLQHGAANRKADVYAAAVVLWEALTSERLFLSDSEAATIARVLTGEVPRPSSLVSDISSELDEVVMRGLARDPTARFDTARDMARALEACAPPTTATRIGEWVETTAGTALAVRARIVSEVEQIEEFPAAEASSRPPRILASSEEPTVAEVLGERRSGVEPMRGFDAAEHRGRQRRVVVATALLAFLIGALGLRALLPQHVARDDARRVAAHEPPTLPSPTVAVVEPSPVLSLVPEVIPSAPPSALAPKPDPSARSKPTGPAHGHVRSQAQPKIDCDPPFTVDQEGHHHYKMECL